MQFVEIPSNLVSDSPLVRDTFDFVNAKGGRASMSEIADAVFCLSHADGELATALVTDLVWNDPRFLIENAQLSLSDDHLESRSLNEVDFVVLDVEAVVVRTRPARIIELAAYRVRAGEIIDEFQTLVNPEMPLPAFIAALTGLSDETLKGAPAFADIVGAWLDFAGDAVLVAHNSDFDVPLLNREIARVFPGRRMRNSELCTVKLARQLVRNSAGHNLDALAEHFGFQIAQRHRAAGDARATAQVLLHLLDELEKRGVRTLVEVRSFRKDEPPQAELDLQLALDI